MWQYEIHIEGEPETLKVIEMSEEVLLKRYGEITKPTTMFLRDFACRTGVFSWSDYTKLQPRGFKKKEVK